jgi:hypothetical protein
VSKEDFTKFITTLAKPSRDGRQILFLAPAPDSRKRECRCKWEQERRRELTATVSKWDLIIEHDQVKKRVSPEQGQATRVSDRFREEELTTHKVEIMHLLGIHKQRTATASVHFKRTGGAIPLASLKLSKRAVDNGKE